MVGVRRNDGLTTTANASLRAIYDRVTLLDNLYNVTQYGARKSAACIPFCGIIASI